MITKKQLMDLPFDEGNVYLIGKTDMGELVATGTRETQEGEDVLVALAGSGAPSVPLGSLVRFNTEFELYDEPKIWEGYV